MPDTRGDLPTRTRILQALTREWGESYWFSVWDLPGGGEEWAAVRRGDGTMLAAASAPRLLAAVEIDVRPVLP
jgi:hypothetical protein